MSTVEKTQQLVRLAKKLSSVGSELRLAQMGLEKMADDYGLSSPQAIDFSKRCDELSSRFTALEDDYLALRQELIGQ